MNERRAREALKVIDGIHQSLNSINKLGLSVSDTIEQRTIWRRTGDAHEAMRALRDLLVDQHPQLDADACGDCDAEAAPPRRRAGTVPACHVRQLTAADLDAYRALHRFGMEESPLGFVDVAETDAARPDADVEAMLTRGDGWGAFDGERLVAKLTIDALVYPSLAHTWWVHAVYVHPDARGTGASSKLIRAAIAYAQSRGALRIALWVNGVNAHAKALYERIGFRQTGHIPGGIKVGDAYADDVLMTLELT
jgi:GNAT superfamily N-acetyltransferase